jgi:hypothetical protein
MCSCLNNKNFLLIPFPNQLIHIFVEGFRITVPVKAQQLCTRQICQDEFATMQTSDMYVKVAALTISYRSDPRFEVLPVALLNCVI